MTRSGSSFNKGLVFRFCRYSYNRVIGEEVTSKTVFHFHKYCIVITHS